MKKQEYKVFESNAGHLHLAFLEDGECTYYATGYEELPVRTTSDLFLDMLRIDLGENPRETGWEGEGNPQKLYEEALQFMTCIATQDGEVYPDRMGSAGKLHVLGITEDRS